MKTQRPIKLEVKSTRKIETKFNRDPYRLPTEIMENPVFSKKFSELEEKEKRGEAHRGKSMIVESVIVDEKSGESKISVRESSYFHTLSLSTMNGSIALTPEQARTEPTGSFGVDSMVISSDGKVFVGTRSMKLQKFPGQLFLGLGEGLKPEDFFLEETSGVSALKWGSARCISEEMGVSIRELDLPEHLHFVELAMEPTYRSLTGYMSWDFREAEVEFSSLKIMEKMINHDRSWEATGEFMDIPDAIVRVKEYIERGDATPASVVYLEYLENLELNIKNNLEEDKKAKGDLKKKIEKNLLM